MKRARFIALVVILACPLTSFAQSNAPATRESVRAELVARTLVASSQSHPSEGVLL